MVNKPTMDKDMLNKVMDSKAMEMETIMLIGISSIIIKLMELVRKVGDR
jgi:hypothetical protein